MQISNTFRKAVKKAYEGEINLDELITTQRPVLMRLVKHALRYKTSWLMSDADDLFQEACTELIKRMWKWEEGRAGLAEYCLYNIGVHLATVVKIEKAKKRHPDPNTSRKIDIWEAVYDQNHSMVYENILPSNDTIEINCAIREAISSANEEMTDLAKDLLMALANNSGNFAESIRDLSSQDHIRQRFGPDKTHMAYVMRKKVMPEIVDYLHPSRIMP